MKEYKGLDFFPGGFHPKGSFMVSRRVQVQGKWDLECVERDIRIINGEEDLKVYGKGV